MQADMRESNPWNWLGKLDTPTVHGILVQDLNGGCSVSALFEFSSFT